MMTRERILVGESLIGRVAAEGRPIVSSDSSRDPRHDPRGREQARLHGLGCWLGVPLRRRSGVLGVLFVLRGHTQGQFGDDDVGLLEAFGDQVAIAVENAAALRQEQERRHQLDTLRHLTGTMVNTVAVEELAQQIVDAVPDAFRHDSGFIGGVIAIIDAGGRRLRAHAMTRIPAAERILAMIGRPFQELEDAIDPPMNLLHEVALTGTCRDSARLADFVTPSVSGLIAQGIEHLIGMHGGVAQPITVHGPTLGVFLFVLSKPTDNVTSAERALMADFANTAGIALENVRLYAASEQLTLMDPLTGIANRRHFDRKLTEEIARSSREKTPLTLLLIDIDQFKAYNDTHGHQAGDRVLRGVAEALYRSVRSTDFVARYGGEEFAILLPSTDAGGGRAVGEKARRAVADARLDLTISVGGSSRLASDGTALSAAPEATLVTMADSALYAAKRAGRNRTIVV